MRAPSRTRCFKKCCRGRQLGRYQFIHPLFTGGNAAYEVDKDGDGIVDAVDIDFGDSSNVLFESGVPDQVIDIPLIRGPWDVDNDLDGIADSIWADLGAPIKTAPDGRLYSPCLRFSASTWMAAST